MRIHAFLVAGISGAALLFTAACGQKKITECNNLIQVINTGVQSLEKGGKGQGDDGGANSDLKAVADAMDKVAVDASKVDLSVPELKKFSSDYQGMAKDVAKYAREMLAASDVKDVKRMSDAQTAMEKAVKQEDPLVDSINKFCQAP
jgi:hypothetical protein